MRNHVTGEEKKKNESLSRDLDFESLRLDWFNSYFHSVFTFDYFFCKMCMILQFDMDLEGTHLKTLQN